MTECTTRVNTPLEFLYRLKASDGTLLYVGITTDWPARMKQHQADKPWWSEVAAVELVRMSCTRLQVEAIERAVIKAERPVYNVQHNPTRKLTVPKAETREPLFWRELNDGNVDYFYPGDRVFTFGRLATLVDCPMDGDEMDWLVVFDGDTDPIPIDGTCHIRHAVDGDEDWQW